MSSCRATNANTASHIVRQAIFASRCEDRIVHLRDVDASVHDALVALCDDAVTNGDITEYWGGEDGSGPWRIHVEVN